MIDNELLLDGEALSAPCFTAIKLPVNIHYLLDASIEAVGGLCAEKKVVLTYDLPRELTTELKRKADLGETCTVAINLLRGTGNGCNSGGYGRTFRRPTGCGRGQDTDAR